jgi:hypothetical protein
MSAHTRLINAAYEKALEIHSIVENHFYDSGGLFYSFLDSRTKEPITAELADLYPIRDFDGKPSNTEWMSHENSGMAAGAYLSALCLRRQAELQNYDTDKMIERVFNSILRTYNISSAVGGDGFFCKTWGGRASRETTVDQYSAVITGLRDLALTNHRLSKNAREMAVKMALWWMRNNYICRSCGRSGRVSEHLPWSFSCLAFIRIAYELSGDRMFKTESERLCREHGCDKPYPRSGAYIKSFWPEKPYIGIRRMAAFHHTVVDGLCAMFGAWPERAADWKRLLNDFWRMDVNMGIDDGGLAYACYLVNENTNEWTVPSAGFIFPRDKSHEKDPFTHHYWIGGFKSGSLSCMTAASSASIGAVVPELAPDCRRAAGRILPAVCADKMIFVIDEENQDCPTFGEVRKRMLDCRCAGQWLRAYWQGRRLNWWD